MTRFLSRLFNIRPDEWPRFLIIYVMYIVMLIGLYWGEALVEAAFLRQVGVEYLPLAIMGSAVCSILAIVVYTAFADRVSNDTLLIALMLISMVGIVIGLGFLYGGWVVVTFPLLYLIINVLLRNIFTVHWHTYVNGFYDTRTAKRIVPVLGSGSRVGGIVAGLTMPLVNYVLSPDGIIIAWLGAVGMMALLAWGMPRILGDKPTATSDQPTAFDIRHAMDNIREGYRYVSQSSYLRWMALATLAMMVLMAFVNYQAGKIILTDLETVENISNFTGLLNGLSNLIALPFQLFLLSRVIGRVGLGSMALLFPATTVVSCAGLILSPNLLTATLGYLDRTTLRTALHNPIDSLLYNAVPLRVKGRARAFIGGLIVPIGSLVGGLLLILPYVADLLPALIGTLAVGYLVSAWVIRRKYAQALIDMLEQEDFSFLLSQEATSLTVTDSATLGWLQGKLEQPDASPEFRIFMAQLISQVGGSQAVPILGQAARAAADARTRSAIIDVLAAADLRGDAVRQIYTDFLADPEGRVRQSAIIGLEQLAGPTDQWFLSQMLDMVQDPDLHVRSQVLSALVRSGDFYQFPLAVQVLDDLLADEDPDCKAQGVRVLGQVGDERAVRRLAEFLSDPADQVRLEAVLTVETLSQSTLPALKAAGSTASPLILEKVSNLLSDPVERARRAALTVLGRLGSRESHRLLVRALTDPSPQVRATAVETLAQIGKAIIPIVHPELDSSDPQLRKMATVVLSRIDPGEFGALIIGSGVTGSLLTIYQNYGLADALTPGVGYRGIDVLQSALRERNRQLVDEIFYLLTAIHNPSDVGVVADSLRSPVPRIRANAVEALESLTSPQTTRLIAPLFEPELPMARLQDLSQETWDMEQPEMNAAVHQLVTPPTAPWLRTIATYALGEIGAALAPRDEPPAADPDPEEVGPAGLLDGLLADTERTDKGQKRPARRVSTADLFGALTDALEDTPPPPAAEPTPAEEAPTPEQPPSGVQLPFTLSEIEAMLEVSLADPVDEVRLAAQAARRILAGQQAPAVTKEEKALLSTIERIIFLKEVSFFQSMTIDQLKVLAEVCEEELFEEGTRIFDEGDPGGALYVIVSGRVGIEREGQRQGSYARLATLEPRSYFGEMSLFDNRTRSAAALAVRDTLTLRLRREPLLVLVRHHPDLSLELINILSQRLRESNERVAQLTRTRPRELHSLFDGFD